MKKLKTIEQKAQDFALGQILSEWQDGMTYEEILEVLESDNPEANESEDGGLKVVSWMPYENDEDWQIAQTIKDMVSELVLTFGNEAKS